jgi:hypothetical protein
LVEQTPGVAFNIETITGYAPTFIPYGDPDSGFWRAYPDMLARDFARFVTLAQAGPAEPLQQLTLPTGVHLPPPGPAGDGLRDQQRRHFEESVAYAQQTLGLGERMRSSVMGGA